MSTLLTPREVQAPRTTWEPSETPSERSLMRDLGRAVIDFGLIGEGDRILVAMSGGKDSYAMFCLLSRLVRRAPVRFELVAVHLNQGHPGYDGRPLREWMETRCSEFHILSEDTYSVVTDKIPEGKTYCSLCSRLRRGILYRAADELRCNKIALGHHRDDAIETLMLNMFFAGKMAAMPAKLTSDDGAHVVIRPMIYCGEAELTKYAVEQEFPILPCNLCGSQSQAQRRQMKELLNKLESEHPAVRNSMLSAIGNVNPRHLLDRGLAAATAHIPDRQKQAAPSDDGLIPKVRLQARLIR